MSNTSTSQVMGNDVPEEISAPTSASSMRVPVLELLMHQGKNIGTNRKKNDRIIRKLSGYLWRMNDEYADVIFVIDDRNVEYRIPGSKLSKNGITREGQPFDFFEKETQDSNGLWSTVYQYVPLCNAEEAEKTSIKFDPETQKLYDLLLKNDVQN